MPKQVQAPASAMTIITFILSGATGVNVARASSSTLNDSVLFSSLASFS